MREILFRGKRVIDGKWVESCCPLGEIHSGTVTYDFDSKTVCQYTGLTDKNGGKIFEGDIVRENLKGLKLMERKVVWDKEEGAWMSESESGVRYGIGNANSQSLEVIGNIFDNPELIGDQP